MQDSRLLTSSWVVRVRRPVVWRRWNCAAYDGAMSAYDGPLSAYDVPSYGDDENAPRTTEHCLHTTNRCTRTTDRCTRTSGRRLETIEMRRVQRPVVCLQGHVVGLRRQCSAYDGPLS